MRKHIIGNGPRDVSAAEQGWLDLELLAQVEITSEDVDNPIESALIPGTGLGWRAAQPGEQTGWSLRIPCCQPSWPNRPVMPWASKLIRCNPMITNG